MFLAENPDMDQSLFEIDPETASDQDLAEWSDKLVQSGEDWGFLKRFKKYVPYVKKAAKLAWKHRRQIMAAARMAKRFL